MTLPPPRCCSTAAPRSPPAGSTALSAPSGRGRHAPLHGQRAGPLPHRRRRARVRRPGLLLGPDDPRPRPPGGPRRGAGGGHPRLQLRHAERERGPAGRGDRRPGRAGRAGAPGQQRHRGDDERAAPGPGVHRPLQGGQVRRALPRSRRRPARRRRQRASRPSPCPTPPGSPASSAGETIVLPYNDLAAARGGVRRARRRRSPPSSPRRRRATWAWCRPPPGFTEALRRLDPRARRAAHLRRGDDRLPGAAPPAGTASRARTTRARPTCSPSARSWAAAFPAAAFGGRADIMAMLAPPGPVYQAGTLSGNPVATAAGLATLRGCTPEVYARLDVAAAIASAARRGADRGRRAAPSSAPATCSRVFFRDGEVRDYDDAEGPGRRRRSRPFFHSMLSQGVYLPPSAFEAWFVSAATTTPRRPGHRAPCPRRRARRRLVCDTRVMSPCVPPTPRSSTCCATVRCTTPRAFCTADCPASTCPSSASRWPSVVGRRTWPTATSAVVVASPLERAQETAAPIAAPHGLPIDHRRPA